MLNRVRWALALALACVCPLAAAQAVSLYGVVDVAVERLDGVGASAHSDTRMPGLTGSIPSRIGLRATEELGSGLRAVATLEGGLAANNGTLNQGGRIFGRQAFVGLGGPWGTVSLGRQYTMLFWSLLDADVMGPALYGSGSLDNYIPNARADNAVAYRGTFGGFTAGATFSFGRDTVSAGPGPAGTNCPGRTATDALACREWSVLARYDDTGWGVAAARDEIRGGPGAFAGLVSGALKDVRSSFNGYTQAGALKLTLGVIGRRNDGSATTPKSSVWYAGASFPVAPAFLFEAQVFRLRFEGSANGAVLAAARGTYSLSRRTALYATLGRIANDGSLALSVSGGAAGDAPAAGHGQTGLAAGVRHSF